MGNRLGRRRFRWLVTACVVVAVAGLVSSARAARSEATRTVTYRGYKIQVPASWRVVDLAKSTSTCVRFDVHAVYLGHPAPDQSCPSKILGRTEALLVEPIDNRSKGRVTADTVWAPRGMAAVPTVPARTGHEDTIGVTQAGLLVTASYGDDRGTIEQILGGATLTQEAQPTTELAPTTSTAASVVVPGTFTGKGFDACSAPSPTAMQAWLTSSPYRAANVYIGGIHRTCEQPNLTASWVSEQTSAGWALFPTYVGLQAPCSNLAHRIDPATAPAQGREAAEDAVKQAGLLGMAAGSVIYYDMEGYSTTDSACTQTVLTYLSNWSTRLHELNYLSGVYSSMGSGIRDLVNAYNNTNFVRPDHIWFARWDDVATVSDPAIRDTYWANHQRIKQYQEQPYQAPHNETYGGKTINIDNDYLDVASNQEPPPPPGDDGDQDAPAVVTLGTEIHAFARGTDNRLYEAVFRSGSGWSAWAVRGTLTIAGTPSVIKYSTGMNLYARGTDQRLYETYYRSGKGWSNWSAHAGLAVAGDPAAATNGTNINIFVRGTDQQLYETSFQPTTRWSAWGVHAGVTLAGNPAVVSVDTELHVFARGLDGGLYETFFRSGFGWSSWLPHAGRMVGGDPSGVKYSTGINLYARGTDQRLYETYLRSSRGWSNWGAHGGVALAGDPTAFLYGSEIHVLARTTSNVMAETFYRSGVGWSAWALHGGVTIAGTPAAVLYGTGINVYARGADHRLYETYFRPGAGWSAWHVKGGTAVGIA